MPHLSKSAGAALAPTPSAPDQTQRKDAGKDPWHLLPFDALREVVLVLAFGANKYRERGWESGMAWSRCVASLQRHFFEWYQLRNDRDPETGLLHLGHIACNALFLVAFQLRGMVDDDDRPTGSLPRPAPTPAEPVISVELQTVRHVGSPGPKAMPRKPTKRRAKKASKRAVKRGRK